MGRKININRLVYLVKSLNMIKFKQTKFANKKWATT